MAWLNSSFILTLEWIFLEKITFKEVLKGAMQEEAPFGRNNKSRREKELRPVLRACINMHNLI